MILHRFAGFLTRRPRVRPIILMYHRVATVGHDPWELCVSPENFAAQAQWLAQSRHVFAMNDFVARHAAGDLPADAVAITFDDGYVDNWTVAQPILKALGLPATLFVVSGAIDATEPFWWDELTDLILASPSIDAEVRLGSDTILLRADDAQPDPDWRAGTPPRGVREAAYIRVWQYLQRVSVEERDVVLAYLRSCASCPSAPAARPMTSVELQEMLDDGTFTIGAHTIHHDPLTTLGDAHCQREITESVSYCRAIGQPKPIGFAYPYGDLDERVRRMTCKSGAAWACTTRAASVAPHEDRLTFPRLAVGNWTPVRLAEVVGAAP